MYFSPDKSVEKNLGMGTEEIVSLFGSVSFACGKSEINFLGWENIFSVLVHT